MLVSSHSSRSRSSLLPDVPAHDILAVVLCGSRDTVWLLSVAQSFDNDRNPSLSGDGPVAEREVVVVFVGLSVCRTGFGVWWDEVGRSSDDLVIVAELGRESKTDVSVSTFINRAKPPPS